ncbi:MAG: NADH-quinone oxidoreductase subunit N [Acidimicrobiales bacterium]|nr:NADH-quinone oxidoreductase subunit N [Acidimicrobiales bacterium]MDG2218513.1 NADH-quinone oxidoreductase subunit N [Acidimicrobiales bacterium]
MLAQLDNVPVETPEIVWAGLLPLLILSAGALLLVMFRSVVKRLPDDIEPYLVTAVGPLTVLGMWFAAGFAGTEAPLAAVRDDIGDPVFFLGFVLVMAVAGSLVRTMEIGLDAAVTAGLGLAAFAATWGLWDDRWQVDGPFNAIGDQFSVDGFGLVFSGVLAASVVLVAFLLDEYLRREDLDGPEMYILMLLSAAGGIVMSGANDLIVIFLGIETLSIAVYVMAAMHNRRTESQEAGLKYFVLGAFASAFLLYGISFTYGATGSTNLLNIQSFLRSGQLTENGLLMAAFGLLLVGFGFKVAAVPFHAWTPDVYQGAPTPVVAFMASAVKAAGFAALLRVFMLGFFSHVDDWRPAVGALAVLTLVVGSVMAIVQSDIKRMLAYSSISHAGFILVGVHAASLAGINSVAFYAVAYTFLVIGSFGVLTVVSGTGDRATSLDDLNGMAKRRPALAFVFTVFLLAQAGVPLTAGFVAKFEVIRAAVDGKFYWLAVVAMLTAVVSAFLYLRIVLSMYLGTQAENAADLGDSIPKAAALAIGIAFVVTVGLGILPGLLSGLVGDALPALSGAG